jgi:glyoxylase-like metal-dependent hydrolase (beta-lactamase superfamily II)
VPGHTRGHLALRDTASGAWFVSDAVLGVSVPLADGTPAFAPTYRYVDDYLRTIDALESAAPPLLCTAHYGVFAGADALEFLRASREFVHELDRATIAALDDLGPSTLQRLLPAVNRQVARWPLDGTEGSLAFPLVGHLERLAARRLVAISGGPDGRGVVAAARP